MQAIVSRHVRRLFRTRLVVGLVGLALVTLGGQIALAVHAQDFPSDTLAEGYDKQDILIIQPILHAMLDEDRAGTARPWASPSGRHGSIMIVSGGTREHSDRAKVRVTVLKEAGERPLITFRYCRVAPTDWRVCG